MKALTGLSQAKFDFLLPAFSHVYQETLQQRYEEGVKAGKRSRKPGAGIQKASIVSRRQIPTIQAHVFSATDELNLL
jgi:hypothetical protein